ncbi:TlpA disulfide reductase family protein [Archangium primigenium]|uniref:TlpA disulfide reductase family protein n=1 Tax=[Archangium] primigenium TaxID=2792470 RepID=UPI00195A032F|nr:TlpA disulfide reductase family protein [Archangium primigenium]MBM7118331.1 TlpA family protein disulfide reductase [Archangium primigenium]
MTSVRCLLAVLALSGCASPKPMPSLTGNALQRSSAALGSGTALDFTVRRYPGGEPFSLASERGNVVLLDVWATWCEPCRDSLPMYQDLAKHYAARGLKAYALNVDEDTRGIAAFLKETKVDPAVIPVLLDAGANVADSVLHLKGMPTSLLIDRRGQVRFVHEGFNEDDLARSQQEIETLLQEEVPRER